MAQKKKFSLSTPTTTPKDRKNRQVVGYGISVLLHAVVLAIPIADIVAQARPAPNLEVVLVNARSATAPKDPQVLAQANLDGGGTSDEDILATSPLPPQESNRSGDDLIDRKRGQQADIQPRPEEQEVLTQENSPVAIAKTPPTPDQGRPQPTASTGDDTADARAMALELQAAIDRRTQEYNSRPRRHSVGARAREERFALYVESWRSKTERIGELNYPAAARGKIYGALVMTVSIKSDGSVEKIVINKSSGQKVLDDAAQRIVHLGDPYAEFPPNIAKDTDVLDITRTWTFTNENKLRTSNK
jgi:protein TonB